MSALREAARVMLDRYDRLCAAQNLDARDKIARSLKLSADNLRSILEGESQPPFDRSDPWGDSKPPCTDCGGKGEKTYNRVVARQLQPLTVPCPSCSGSPDTREERDG